MCCISIRIYTSTRRWTDSWWSVHASICSDRCKYLIVGRSNNFLTWRCSKAIYPPLVIVLMDQQLALKNKHISATTEATAHCFTSVNVDHQSEVTGLEILSISTCSWSHCREESGTRSSNIDVTGGDSVRTSEVHQRTPSTLYTASTTLRFIPVHVERSTHFSASNVYDQYHCHCSTTSIVHSRQRQFNEVEWSWMIPTYKNATLHKDWAVCTIHGFH